MQPELPTLLQHSAHRFPVESEVLPASGEAVEAASVRLNNSKGVIKQLVAAAWGSSERVAERKMAMRSVQPARQRSTPGIQTKRDAPMCKMSPVRLKVPVACNDIGPVPTQDPVDVHRLPVAVHAPIGTLQPNPAGICASCMPSNKLILNAIS